VAGIGPIGAVGGIGVERSIGRLGAIDAADGAGASVGLAGQAVAGAPASQGSSFLDTLGGALGSLNSQLVSADAASASFAAGGSADLHEVMLQMQEASIGLRVGISVRDRLLEAYQELMRLNV
jgi:flagellar hook-basal body complex protein FliE